MQDNGETQGAMPSLNDIISGNQQDPNQVTYTKVTEQPDSTTKVVRKVVTTQQQPVTESTYYAKKVTTTTTITRGNQGPTTTNVRYSNAGTSGSNRNQTNSYSRPTTQTNKTTTTTTTVQRGQYGQNTRNSNANTQSYRGNQNQNQRNVKPPTKMGTSQSFAGNQYQPKRPQPSTSYRPKAKSPEPGSIKRKTINRGKPVENVQITHIIYSSGPAEFHITEELNLENLNTAPIQISKTDRAKLQKSGKVTASCSCDGVEIAQPKKPNLKGKTLHYQHAQGLGMTNDKNENINPMFYSSEIKKLDPISKLKDKEIIENVENFRSNGKTYKSPSPNRATTTKTATKTTTYNRNSNYNQSNQNYRGGSGATSNTTRGGMASSTTGRGGVGTASSTNRGGAGTTFKTTTYTRGSNMGSGGDGEIIKDTRTKVQMGSRSYKNPSQPTTYTTTERKVYTQKNFFNK